MIESLLGVLAFLAALFGILWWQERQAVNYYAARADYWKRLVALAVAQNRRLVRARAEKQASGREERGEENRGERRGGEVRSDAIRPAE